MARITRRITLFSIALLLVMACVQPALAGGEGLIVELRAEVTLDPSKATQRFVRLQDIATLNGNKKLINDVADVLFGRAPKDSLSKTVSKGDIRERLSLLGINARELSVTGPDEVRVWHINAQKAMADSAGKTETKPADTQEAVKASTSATPKAAKADKSSQESKHSSGNIADDLAKALAGEVKEEVKEEPKSNDNANFIQTAALDLIQSKIARQMKADVDDISVTIHKMNRQLETYALQRGVILDLRNAENPGSPLGRHSFILSIAIEGNEIDGLSMTCDIARMVRVAVVASDLRRGQEINKDHIAFERRPFSTRVSNYFTSIEELEFAQSKNTLRAGDLITPADIEPALLVKRGDVINVRVIRNGFDITFKATAKTDGALGEEISVTYLVENNENRGRGEKNNTTVTVTGRGTAEVKAKS